MNILLIGGSGNLGYNLYKNLKKSKNIKNIFIIDYKKNQIPAKNFFQTDLSKKKLDPKNILSLKKFKIDLVFILAFDINFKKAKKDYMRTGTNIINNSLNICKQFEIKKIVYFSSFAVYGNKKNLISEKSLPKPLNIYGKLKLFCEKKVNSFCRKENSNYIILRISQVYGHSITSSIIGKFHQFKIMNKKVTIINNGGQYRDYVYIDDFVGLIIKIINHNFKRNYIFNMCSGKKTKTLKIVKLLKLKYVNLTSQNEIKFLLGDNRYIKKILRWTAKTSIKDGINKILQYKKI